MCRAVRLRMMPKSVAEQSVAKSEYQIVAGWWPKFATTEDIHTNWWRNQTQAKASEANWKDYFILFVYDSRERGDWRKQTHRCFTKTIMTPKRCSAAWLWHFDWGEFVLEWLFIRCARAQTKWQMSTQCHDQKPVSMRLFSQYSRIGRAKCVCGFFVWNSSTFNIRDSSIFAKRNSISSHLFDATQESLWPVMVHR